MQLHAIALIGIGGGIGSVCRHWFAAFVMRLMGSGFPYGVLAVNVLGSFTIGMIAGIGARYTIPSHALLFLTTGFLGGFTTFSAFSLDVALLYQRGEMGAAFIYAVISVILSVAATFAGLWLVR